MFLAPNIPMTATLQRAPSGRAAVFHTLRLVRDAIDKGKRDPEIMSAAVGVVYMQRERDDIGAAKALFQYVRDHIRYIRDVHNLETLAAPRLTLARQVGDCDDQTALLGAMLEAVGYPTRLVMAAYYSDDFEHIYLHVNVNGEWFACDPTEHQPFGWEPPGAHKQFIEGA